MDRELVKQLKDAGFPSSERWNFMNGIFCNDDGYAVPTLEELIEACGEEISSLFRFEGYWIARPTQEFNADGEGSTPTEAVARLWLALNKK